MQRLPQPLLTMRFEAFSSKSAPPTSRDNQANKVRKNPKQSSPVVRSVPKESAVEERVQEVEQLNQESIIAMNVVKVLQGMLENGDYLNTEQNQGNKILITQLLQSIKEQPNQINSKIQLELLDLCGKLRYFYREMTSTDQLTVRDVLEGIPITHLSSNLSIYCHYFAALASLRVKIGDFSSDRMKQLLTVLKRFHQDNNKNNNSTITIGNQLTVNDGEKLITAFEYLLILDKYSKDIDAKMTEGYEHLLNQILREKYQKKNLSALNKEEERLRLKLIASGDQRPVSLFLFLCQ